LQNNNKIFLNYTIIKINIIFFTIFSGGVLG
jgi:hypothetical protein